MDPERSFFTAINNVPVGLPQLQALSILSLVFLAP